MVVLHKLVIGIGRFVEGFLVKALVKEAARVAKYFRFNDQHVWNCGVGNVHGGVWGHGSRVKPSCTVQLRFTSFAVINLRRDLHPQEGLC